MFENVQDFLVGNGIKIDVFNFLSTEKQIAGPQPF